MCYIGNKYTLTVSNMDTIINPAGLKKECGDLDELLISARDVEFVEVLGEGINITLLKTNITTMCFFKIMIHVCIVLISE